LLSALIEVKNQADPRNGKFVENLRLGAVWCVLCGNGGEVSQQNQSTTTIILIFYAALRASENGDSGAPAPAADCRLLMPDKFGIDMGEVILCGNACLNEYGRFRIHSGAACGPPRQGWNSSAAPFDLVDDRLPVPGRDVRFTRQFLTL
jgi:hypothetical protein